MRRVTSLLAVTSVLGGLTALATGGVAAGAPSRATAALPTITIALSGTRGVSVSGSTVSGAVRIVATHAGPGMSFYGVVRLNPGATIQQAAAAVQQHHGDINALDPYGALLVSAAAPGTVETVLTPGSYVGLNITGNGRPGFAPFTVSSSAAPAALPAARATETSIEFAFRGPSVLRDGTMVRAHNGGYLVHMDTLIGVRSAAIGREVIALMKAGHGHRAQGLTNGHFLDLIGPASPGALQQEVLHATPGYYVQACFMNTQDGRDHTQLGMARVIRIIK